jgi:hypothetical protein
MRRLVLLGVMFSGCYQEIPENIPCDGDLSCPSEFWCNSIGTCSPLGETTPAVLALEGVANSTTGPFGQTVTIPRGGGTVALKLVNQGGAEAAYPDITVVAPACFDVEGTLPSNLVGIVGAGESVVARQTVARPTAPCPDAVVNVEMKLSQGPSSRRFERTWAGSFTAVLGP